LRCALARALPRPRALQLTKNFSSVCVTDSGALGGLLLGVVTSRDIDFINDRSTPLHEVMTRCVWRSVGPLAPVGGCTVRRRDFVGRSTGLWKGAWLPPRDEAHAPRSRHTRTRCR
jgi:hypothetical protein